MDMIRTTLINLSLLIPFAALSGSAPVFKQGISAENEFSPLASNWDLVVPGTNSINNSNNNNSNSIALRLPDFFKETKHPLTGAPSSSEYQSFSQYEYNGVRIQIGLTQYASEEVANKSVHLLLPKPLPRVEPGAPLPAVRSTDLSGRKVIQIQYEYTMMPMAKRMVYQGLGLVDKSKVWTVIASYKACDQRGQMLASSILESIHFPAESS